MYTHTAYTTIYGHNATCMHRRTGSTIGTIDVTLVIISIDGGWYLNVTLLNAKMLPYVKNCIHIQLYIYQSVVLFYNYEILIEKVIIPV